MEHMVAVFHYFLKVSWK